MDPTGTLYTWVRATAAAHPLAPAIEVQGRVLTYEELLDTADRLAGRLVEANGRPPRAVGLLVSRSLAAYAGYLAALRCGATVVPLNPKFPATRNSTMCRLSEVDVVVVDDEGASQAPEVTQGVAAVALLTEPDRSWEEGLRPWNGPFPDNPDAFAYTLFTSGSTGAPKGVPIRHRHVLPYIRYCVDRYGTGPGDRLSQTFDLTFDPSVFDLFVAWCSGATLVVPQNDDILTPVRFVNEKRISHWFSVPSVVSIAQRLRMLRPGCMPGLRLSLYCGEQLTLSQARAWAEAAPGSVVENIYGPTELTITCIGHRLPEDPAAWAATSNTTVPIGEIYPHLEAVLVDDNGLPADDGELCVRGSQRFDGYLDPAHNAGRFVRIEDGRAHSHDGPPAPDCWYRTGDRVRWENGEMVHLGRLDDQIKVSGYRVELGEIESALRAHPAVTDVVVVPLTGDDGVVELHAGYTGEALDEVDLARLVAVLPSYMRPRGYHHREGMPVNGNGKIDRKRLAAELAEPATVS